MTYQQYERLADELSDTPEYLAASDAGKAAMMRDLADGLHQAEYCVDDYSLRKAAYQASVGQEP